MSKPAGPKMTNEATETYFVECGCCRNKVKMRRGKLPCVRTCYECGATVTHGKHPDGGVFIETVAKGQELVIKPTQ